MISISLVGSWQPSLISPFILFAITWSMGHHYVYRWFQRLKVCITCTQVMSDIAMTATPPYGSLWRSFHVMYWLSFFPVILACNKVSVPILIWFDIKHEVPNRHSALDVDDNDIHLHLPFVKLLLDSSVRSCRWRCVLRWSNWVREEG